MNRRNFIIILTGFFFSLRETIKNLFNQKRIIPEKDLKPDRELLG